MQIAFEMRPKKKKSTRLYLNICGSLNLAVSYIIFKREYSDVGKGLIKLLPFCMTVGPSVHFLLSVPLKPDKIDLSTMSLADITYIRAITWLVNCIWSGKTVITWWESIALGFPECENSLIGPGGSLEALSVRWVQERLAPEGYESSKSGQLPQEPGVSLLSLHLSCHVVAGRLGGSSCVITL